jgi:hypothetical protein
VGNLPIRADNRGMPIGRCALCQVQKELVDSHFLPAASYKALRAAGFDVNEPMVMTHKRVFQSSRQITAHVFCVECEDVFNRRGETWVLDKLATLKAFPLRDMVIASQAIVDEPDFKAFSCSAIPGFQTDNVVHLALGIFWKAAAYSWKILGGRLPRLELGLYEEPLRQFVLGNKQFPEDVCLVIYLDSSTPPLIATTPPRRFRRDDFHLHSFYMNGMQCCLCVGKQAPVEFREACIATGPGHPIFLIPEAGRTMFAAMQPFTKNSALSKGMLKTFEQWKSLRGRK